MEIRRATLSEYSEISHFYYSVGYKRGCLQSDIVLIIRDQGNLIGAVILATENGTSVLRGMQIHAEFQRKGYGSLLLEEFRKLVLKEECYCLPYTHLEKFYSMIGFKRMDPKIAPDFLQNRWKDYCDRAMDVIIMRKPIC